jgi:hypothetical protein
MQTLKERYVQKNRNKLLHETHRRKMLIIEAIEQAQLENSSALIKKLENFKQLVPDFSPAIDEHLNALRQQKFGGEVARAVGFVASLETGFSQLGQVLPNFFGEKEFNDPKNEKNSIEDLLSGDPGQKKRFESLIEKVFSRTDGFWNKLKGFLKGPKSMVGEMIDVKTLKSSLLGTSVGAIKKAVQNFAAGPQADDMKKDVAAVVKNDASTGGGGPGAGGGGDGGGADGEKPAATPGAAAPAKDPTEKITRITTDVAEKLGWTEEKDGKKKIKKSIVKSGKAKALQDIIVQLEKMGKLTEALRRGAIKLQIEGDIMKKVIR